MNYICGSYHNCLPNFTSFKLNVNIRLYEKKIEEFKLTNLCAIGIDHLCVCINYKEESLVNFLVTLPKHINLLVLTKRERDILYSYGILEASNIYVFEELFPIFNGIKFINACLKNYEFLKNLIAIVIKRNLERKTVNYLSNYYYSRIIRKIKFKSNLDQAFAYASSAPYQEVFRFIENRPNRTIIAFDFNSMYASCLEGLFPNPKNLEVIHLNCFLEKDIKLEIGLYRVKLSQPCNEFIKNFHALKYSFLNDKFSFKFPENDTIETLLHTNEIEYYRNHFEEIYLIDAVTSKTPILHPLIKNSKQVYSDRLNYKKQNNKTFEKICKLELATMYSCIKKRYFKNIEFQSIANLLIFLEQKFGLIQVKNQSLKDFILKISRPNFIEITFQKNNTIHLKYIDIESNQVIYSLFSQVLANARIKMLSTIEYINKFTSVEICYTNVDSIHISIDTTLKEEFYNFMQPLISNDIGSLKLENEADSGFWFDTGRYWLLRNKNAIQFKNLGIHNPYIASNYQSVRSFYKIYKTENKLIPIKYTWKIENLFSFRKKTMYKNSINVIYERFNLRNICNFSLIQNSLLEEIRNSAEYKVKVFKYIQNG